MSPSVGTALAKTLFQSYLSDPREVQEGCSFLGRWKSMLQTAALAPLLIWVLSQTPPNHLATEAHKLKPSFLRYYFLGCLEVVCKLSGEKGQAAAEHFGKPASWRRGWRALSAVGEGSARTSSATPEEPQSKTSGDKETRPECFSLSKNKQQQKSRKLNPRPSSGSAENYEAGFSQRSSQLISGYCW